METRIIKFRTWENGLMSYPHDLLGDYIRIDGVMFNDNIKKFDTPNIEIGINQHNPILMQFTGREDAEINGNEVWDGDIIENCDTKSLQIVYWNNEQSAWYCRYIEDEKRIVSLCDSLGNLNKVVGNIYENSDLINPTHTKQ